jgi:hypothetical protein
LPFDVQDMSTVTFTLADPDEFERAREALRKQVEWLQEGKEVQTPVSVSFGLQKMLESGDPREQDRL